MNTSQQTRGMWLGLLGVAIFAVTLPMTRLATGTAEAPQLSPWFVTFGRATLAGALSIAFLLLTRAPWPTRAQRRPLALAVLGNALGFPLLLGFALRHVSSGHAAVVLALLPLVTAAAAAWVMHQRARLGFWLSAAAGASLVVVYSLFRAQQHSGGFAVQWADLLLLGAVLMAAMGYVFGAQVTPSLGAERVICWICVMALPVTLPGALLTWPQQRDCHTGLAGPAVRRRVFDVGRLFCLVSRPGPGRRPAGEPDPAAATLFEHTGGGAAVGRTIGIGDARFCTGRGGQRVYWQTPELRRPEDNLKHNLKTLNEQPTQQDPSLPTGGRVHRHALPGQPAGRGAGWQRAWTTTPWQRFARWTNLSETTFVLPASAEAQAQGADYRLRIFTPGGELPFAGHPTLGSCHAWLAHGGQPQQPGQVVQECGVGLVTLRRDGTRLAFGAPPLRQQRAGAGAAPGGAGSAGIAT